MGRGVSPRTQPPQARKGSPALQGNLRCQQIKLGAMKILWSPGLLPKAACGTGHGRCAWSLRLPQTALDPAKISSLNQAWRQGSPGPERQGVKTAKEKQKYYFLFLWGRGGHPGTSTQLSLFFELLGWASLLRVPGHDLKDSAGD